MTITSQSLGAAVPGLTATALPASIFYRSIPPGILIAKSGLNPNDGSHAGITGGRYNSPGSDPITYFAGSDHTCAVTSDGAAWCWGQNFNGQLGDGTTTDSTAPVQVSALSGVTSISAGGGHTCAVVSAGTGWCWGLNTVGQLGDGQTHQTCGTFDCSPDPVQVMNLAGLQSMSAGGRHNCVSITGGTAWCWGSNTQGQLGDGTTTGGATPVQVAGLSDVEVVSCAGGHTCAVLLDGTAWCWGRNHLGQLGNGTTDDSLVPVEVLDPY